MLFLYHLLELLVVLSVLRNTGKATSSGRHCDTYLFTCWVCVKSLFTSALMSVTRHSLTQHVCQRCAVCEDHSSGVVVVLMLITYSCLLVWWTKHDAWTTYNAYIHTPCSGVYTSIVLQLCLVGHLCESHAMHWLVPLGKLIRIISNQI